MWVLFCLWAINKLPASKFASKNQTRAQRQRVAFGSEEQRQRARDELFIWNIKSSSQAMQRLRRAGTGDRTRTGTVFPPRDFKSRVSANFTTPAHRSRRGEKSSPRPLLYLLKLRVSSQQQRAELRHTFNNGVRSGSFVLGSVAVAIEHAEAAESGGLRAENVVLAVAYH